MKTRASMMIGSFVMLMQFAVSGVSRADDSAVRQGDVVIPVTKISKEWWSWKAFRDVDSGSGVACKRQGNATILYAVPGKSGGLRIGVFATAPGSEVVFETDNCVLEWAGGIKIKTNGLLTLEATDAGYAWKSGTASIEFPDGTQVQLK